MTILILGLVMFLGIHSVRIVAAPVRDAQVAASPKRWKGLYSLISAGGLGLIIWGWILARPTAPQVYDPPAWGRHATLALVWMAFVLMPTANAPTGRIKATVRHPMLLGVIFWSSGHLLANGDQASAALFGSVLVWALHHLATAPSPKAPPPVATNPRSDIIAVLAGTVLWCVFVVFLHRLLFGVSPLG